MKILLIAPPKSGMDYLQGHPPVGLGYIATVLRKIGHTVDIQDSIINGWGLKDVSDYIGRTGPDIVGVTVFSSALSNTYEILDGVKRNNPKIITIVGGPHPTAAPAHTLKYLSNADFAFQGEAEIPLEHFDRALKGQIKISDVPGLIWREAGSVRFNEIVEHKHLEDFGFPAWDLIDPRRYFKCAVIGDKATAIYASRGCPFGCKFCVKLGRKLRHRTLDNIWQEISYLKENYGIERFHLGDEGFPINIGFVKEFCRYMIAKKAKFRFEAARGVRLNALDEEMLSLMKEAGFGKFFAVGIESSVARVRELMDKQLSQEELTSGLALLNKYGFRPDGNFILGYPGETKDEMLQTIDWAVKSKHLWGASFTPFIPLPGAPVVDELIAKGKFPEDFDFTQLGTDRVLYAPEGMTTQELDDMRKLAIKRFYFRPRIIMNFIFTGRWLWAAVRFIKVFFPDWMLPKKWRR
jgi:radical SAM superfamily enzyme YgiQ (UPF0313 family)